MRSTRIFLAVIVCLLWVSSAMSQTARSYVGFDRNTYPGDREIQGLSRTFAFTGFWLNNPPGATSNNWSGKRQTIRKTGMGFLVLWNGRPYKELGKNAQKLGGADAKAAVAAAQKEGFPKGTVIFLDQEEGGRLLPEQKAYLYAWIDGVTAEGFRTGVYCSGIAATEESGAMVITAEDIQASAGKREILYWVANDACPPSPGCVQGATVKPGDSGLKFVDVWQYAQSPLRADLTASCKQTYDPTTNCYVQGTKIDVDLNVAGTRDPSKGR
jgi:Domain of unknown function (DUF1906)